MNITYFLFLLVIDYSDIEEFRNLIRQTNSISIEISKYIISIDSMISNMEGLERKVIFSSVHIYFSCLYLTTINLLCYFAKSIIQQRREVTSYGIRYSEIIARIGVRTLIMSTIYVFLVLFGGFYESSYKMFEQDGLVKSVIISVFGIPVAIGQAYLIFIKLRSREFAN